MILGEFISGTAVANKGYPSGAAAFFPFFYFLLFLMIG